MKPQIGLGCAWVHIPPYNDAAGGYVDMLWACSLASLSVCLN